MAIFRPEIIYTAYFREKGKEPYLARNRMFDIRPTAYSAYVKSKDAGNMPGWSIDPFFPGYTFDFGVYLQKRNCRGRLEAMYIPPGMYGNALLDIASMHPASIIAEESFNPEYTKISLIS